MLRSLIFKPTLEISAVPDRNPLFVKLSDGSTRNGYKITIVNKTHEKKIFNIRATSPQSAQIKAANGDLEHLEVAAGEVGNFKIYAILPQEITSQNEEGRSLIELTISDNKEEKKISAVFISK